MIWRRLVAELGGGFFQATSLLRPIGRQMFCARFDALAKIQPLIFCPGIPHDCTISSALATRVLASWELASCESVGTSGLLT